MLKRKNYGTNENHTMENAHAVEDAGASWLTVHARTKADGYTP
ncbi:tRNA-dihydrouridine synthase, partial [Staphylococcus aureus]